MIRGHRRKGFKDPPKPVNVATPTEISNLTETPVELTIRSPKDVQQKHQMDSPIDKSHDCHDTIAAQTIEPVLRNKRLFDSSGYHDPKNALQPAKIRLRRLKLTPKKNSLQVTPSTSPEILAPQASPPTFQQSSSIVMNSQTQQIYSETTPVSHNQTVSDTQNMQSLNPTETNRSPAIRRGRRIKITPRRDMSIKFQSQNSIGRPKMLQYMPATAYSNVQNVYSPQISVLSQNQMNLGMFH